MRRYAWLAVIVGLVAGGCKDSSPSSKPALGGKRAGVKIALIMKSRTNPFFARMEEGARETAKAAGVELLVLTLDHENDFQKQAGHVETAIAQGAHAILIAPADSKGIVAPLKHAQEQGVLILNLDNRIDAGTAQQAGLAIAAFIGPDNAGGAEKATRELFRLMGGTGEAAMIRGIRGADNAEQRYAGFQRALADHKGIEVVDTPVGDWETAEGQRKMESLLARFPNLRGVFCANDNMALGALQAIESAHKSGVIYVTAYDAIEPALAAMRAGKLHGTIDQHPELMGRWGVEQALRALAGETIPKETPVPTDLVTPATMK